MTDTTLENIREKTEDADLDNVLKPSVGGYTKKSVQDYLSFLKKQQQGQKDAFSDQIRMLQQEKTALQKKNTELEADIDEAVVRIQKDETELDGMRQRIRQHEESASETVRLKQLLAEANARNEELSSAISALDTEPVISAALGMGELTSFDDGTGRQLTGQLTQLTDETDSFSRSIAAQTAEFEAKMMSIRQQLSKQLDECLKEMAEMRAQILQFRDQAELFDCERTELVNKIGRLTERNIGLERDNTRLKAANMILQRRTGGKS